MILFNSCDNVSLTNIMDQRGHGVFQTVKQRKDLFLLFVTNGGFGKGCQRRYRDGGDIACRAPQGMKAAGGIIGLSRRQVGADARRNLGELLIQTCQQ